MTHVFFLENVVAMFNSNMQENWIKMVLHLVGA